MEPFWALGAILAWVLVSICLATALCIIATILKSPPRKSDDPGLGQAKEWRSPVPSPTKIFLAKIGEQAIEGEYIVEQYGYPSNGWDDAGEPTIVHIVDAWDQGSGAGVELGEADRERIEQDIAADIDSDMAHDEPDFGDDG